MFEPSRHSFLSTQGSPRTEENPEKQTHCGIEPTDVQIPLPQNPGDVQNSWPSNVNIQSPKKVVLDCKASHPNPFSPFPSMLDKIVIDAPFLCIPMYCRVSKGHATVPPPG